MGFPGAQAGDYRHCPFCGLRLSPRGSDGRPACRGCGFVHYRNPIAVVAGVLLSDSGRLPLPGTEVPPERATHVLLVRRTGTFAGRWCLPCGYIEFGEDVRAAVAREVMEETGLLVEVREILAVHSNFHDPSQLSVGNWFTVRYLGGEWVPGSDADQAAFQPICGCPVPLAFPTDVQVLQELGRQGAARRPSGRGEP